MQPLGGTEQEEWGGGGQVEPTIKFRKVITDSVAAAIACCSDILLDHSVSATDSGRTSLCYVSPWPRRSLKVGSSTLFLLSQTRRTLDQAGVQNPEDYTT